MDPINTRLAGLLPGLMLTQALSLGLATPDGASDYACLVVYPSRMLALVLVTQQLMASQS